MSEPPFTTDELLGLANEFAASLGVDHLTKPALLRWVREGLVPAPEPVGRRYRKGVGRVWGALALRRACRLVQLRGHGMRLYSAYRVVLWLEGEDIPISRLRSDLLVVHEHLARDLRRDLRSLFWGDQFAEGRTPRRLHAEAVRPFDEVSATSLPNLLRQFGAPEVVAGALTSDVARTLLTRCVEAVSPCWWRTSTAL
jgi:hypothetical protein